MIFYNKKNIYFIILMLTKKNYQKINKYKFKSKKLNFLKNKHQKKNKNNVKNIKGGKTNNNYKGGATAASAPATATAPATDDDIIINDIEKINIILNLDSNKKKCSNNSFEQNDKGNCWFAASFLLLSKLDSFIKELNDKAGNFDYLKRYINGEMTKISDSDLNGIPEEYKKYYTLLRMLQGKKIKKEFNKGGTPDDLIKAIFTSHGITYQTKFFLVLEPIKLPIEDRILNLLNNKIYETGIKTTFLFLKIINFSFDIKSNNYGDIQSFFEELYINIKDNPSPTCKYNLEGGILCLCKNTGNSGHAISFTICIDNTGIFKLNICNTQKDDVTCKLGLDDKQPQPKWTETYDKIRDVFLIFNNEITNH